MKLADSRIGKPISNTIFDVKQSNRMNGGKMYGEGNNHKVDYSRSSTQLYESVEREIPDNNSSLN